MHDLPWHTPLPPTACSRCCNLNGLERVGTCAGWARCVCCAHVLLQLMHRCPNESNGLMLYCMHRRPICTVYKTPPRCGRSCSLWMCPRSLFTPLGTLQSSHRRGSHSHTTTGLWCSSRSGFRAWRLPLTTPTSCQRAGHCSSQLLGSSHAPATAPHLGCAPRSRQLSAGGPPLLGRGQQA